MAVTQSQYEALLAEYSNQLAAIALLKEHRPYLEMLPSMRRADESLITIPLPAARITLPENLRSRSVTPSAADYGSSTSKAPKEVVRLPCDLAILLCDPEWKIKTGEEILVFIHRPDEDFSELLGRWRQTQVWIDRGYEWLMPARYHYLLNEGSHQVYPLFVVFADTPARIKKGLQGAYLPFVTPTLYEDPTPSPEPLLLEELEPDD